MKQEKQQLKAQMTRRAAVRNLLVGLQLPLSVTTGLANWKRKTVPVGSSFMRFPIPENVLLLMLVFVVLESEDEDEEFNSPIVVFSSACLGSQLLVSVGLIIGMEVNGGFGWFL